MLIQMLTDTANHAPDQIALIYGNKRMTYFDLVCTVGLLATRLSSLGIEQGDTVVILLRNTPEFVSTFYALASLGARAVPLNPQYRLEELKSYFRHLSIRAIIADASRIHLYDDLLTPLSASTVQLNVDSHYTDTALVLYAREPFVTRESVLHTDDALLLFSSGSTGRPKPVPRTQQQSWWEAENTSITLGLSESDTVFCTIPLFHGYGQGICLLASIRSGATVVLVEEPNPFSVQRQRILELLEATHATVFPGVPMQFRLLSEYEGRADLNSLRLCVSSAVPLQKTMAEMFYRKFNVPLRQEYGMAETGLCTMNVDADPLLTSESVGQATRYAKLRIVNEEGADEPVGQVGEIVVTSPALIRGYLGMHADNRDAFRGGYFYTGDLGRLDSDGRLYIVGRKKLFIQVAGEKVDPYEVEDVLLLHPKVLDAAVVGVKIQGMDEEVVKAVLVPEGSCYEKEIRDFCRQRLASFKVPQVIEFRTEIPRSPTGKVLRPQLV